MTEIVKAWYYDFYDVNRIQFNADLAGPFLKIDIKVLALWGRHLFITDEHSPMDGASLEIKMIKTAEELKKHGVLKFKNQFAICGLEYRVNPTYAHTSPARNDEIFKKLGLEKNEFCAKAYGYTAKYGGWPTYQIDDYEALTRLVTLLYVEAEKQAEPEKKPEVVSLESLLTEPKYREMSLDELAGFLNGPTKNNTITYKDWRDLPGKLSTEKAENLKKKWDNAQYEEGDLHNGCTGRFEFTREGSCTCHAGVAPCASCVDQTLACSTCGIGAEETDKDEKPVGTPEKKQWKARVKTQLEADYAGPFTVGNVFAIEDIDRYSKNNCSFRVVDHKALGDGSCCLEKGCNYLGNGDWELFEEAPNQVEEPKLAAKSCKDCDHYEKREEGMYCNSHGRAFEHTEIMSCKGFKKTTAKEPVKKPKMSSNEYDYKGERIYQISYGHWTAVGYWGVYENKEDIKAAIDRSKDKPKLQEKDMGTDKPKRFRRTRKAGRFFILGSVVYTLSKLAPAVPWIVMKANPALTWLVQHAVQRIPGVEAYDLPGWSCWLIAGGTVAAVGATGYFANKFIDKV